MVTTPAPTRSPAFNAPVPRLRWSIWRQWVTANTLAEAFGLGATLLVGIFVLGGLTATLGPIPAAALGVLLGAMVEGGIVGTAQWLVLRAPLPALSWRTWAFATAIGAGLAWALGLTIMALLQSGAEHTTQTPASASVEMPGGWVMAGLAALLGLVTGPVLGIAQWRVLQRHVPQASWWIAANAVAWAAGMVLVFRGTDFIPDSGAVTPAVGALLVLFVLLAGAAVGAIHGLALIWLLRARDRRGDDATPAS